MIKGKIKPTVNQTQKTTLYPQHAHFRPIGPKCTTVETWELETLCPKTRVCLAPWKDPPLLPGTRVR